MELLHNFFKTILQYYLTSWVCMSCLHAGLPLKSKDHGQSFVALKIHSLFSHKSKGSAHTDSPLHS